MARTLGRTLHELGQTMTSEEFAGHWDDWVSNPWGADAWYSASIVQAIWNSAGKTRTEPLELDQCVLYGPPPEKTSEPEVDPAQFFNQFLK